MSTRLLPILLVAALLLPASAFAMPIDDGPTPHVRHTSPPPTTRTIVRTSDDTLPIALAGVAVLVAVASAAFVTIRVPRPSRA